MYKNTLFEDKIEWFVQNYLFGANQSLTCRNKGIQIKKIMSQI